MMLKNRNTKRVARAVLIGAAFFVSAPSYAEDGYWFEMRGGARDAPIAAMQPKIKFGPFKKVSTCYAIGALYIEELNRNNPDKDFAGRCEPGPFMMMMELVRKATEVRS